MLSGIVVLNKAKGMTSSDCVYQLRHLLKIKKIGHAGTLDPEVEGVLPIAIGQATKLIDLMHQKPKTYIGTGLFGVSTDSYDLQGRTMASLKLKQPLTPAQIQAAMSEMTGTIDQVPPIYSAVRVNGKRLYEYARAGIAVTRPHRKVEVLQYKLTESPRFDAFKQQQTFSFKVTCSKGTYVRALVNDLGVKLGVPAVMTQLTRTSSSGFDLSQAVRLKTLADAPTQIANYLMSIESFFADYPQFVLNESQWQRVQNGASLKLPLTSLQLALSYQGKIKAIYQKNSDVYRPDLMLLQN